MSALLDSDDDCVAHALKRFDHVRRTDVEGDQQLSRLATPFFQSDHRFISALRERSAVLLGRSDILKRRALGALFWIPCEMV
jgi:2-polyprenyl-6-methoxyphenol hydroxylase-like FAD-dependent oxidoreductase